MIRIGLIIFSVAFVQSALAQVSAKPEDFEKVGAAERVKHFPFFGKLNLGQGYCSNDGSANQTVIPYTAIDVSQISLIVYDAAAKHVMSFKNLPAGVGEVIIDDKQLEVGLYSYVLFVNGRAIDRKKMEKTRKGYVWY